MYIRSVGRNIFFSLSFSLVFVVSLQFLFFFSTKLNQNTFIASKLTVSNCNNFSIVFFLHFARTKKTQPLDGYRIFWAGNAHTHSTVRWTNDFVAKNMRSIESVIPRWSLMRVRRNKTKKNRVKWPLIIRDFIQPLGIKSFLCRRWCTRTVYYTLLMRNHGKYAPNE